MEVRDGYIVSIFNYCDRWCEACAFTSRCRLFADLARYEAAVDPSLSAVVHAPQLAQDIPPPPPKWLQELIEQANEIASKPITDEEIAEFEPKIMPAHAEIHERATVYCEWVWDWLKQRDEGRNGDPQDPIQVIAWFASLNMSKIYRALSGLAEDDYDPDYPPDHDGSAKVALIGIDRSHAAWMQLVTEGRVTAAAARPCISELEWLCEQLEVVFPNARAFVRPGLDEPDAVAQLALQSFAGDADLG